MPMQEDQLDEISSICLHRSHGRGKGKEGNPDRGSFSLHDQTAHCWHTIDLAPAAAWIEAHEKCMAQVQGQTPLVTGVRCTGPGKFFTLSSDDAEPGPGTGRSNNAERM